jgi:Ca-activated chloride channel family protein
MFKFGFPEMLYLLTSVPLAALLVWLAMRRRKRLLAVFGEAHLISKLARTVSIQRRWFKATLSLVGLLLLLLALARPQYGTRVETVKREGQDIIVALDVSLSMLAQDIRPNRLEKAKLEIASLIDRLQGDRIGLVAFAGEAFVQCPLTLDYAAARMFLSSMDPRVIAVPGTSIAEAVEKSIKAFVEGETRNKVLLLITDGEDHTGRIPDIAERAVEEGIIIHTIGIGSSEGVPIPAAEEGSGFKKDREGTVVLTRLDEETLGLLAEKTGGHYFRASPNQGELDAIFETIEKMDKKELSARQVTLFDEKYQFFLAFGLILLGAEFLIPDSRRLRTRWKGRFE